MYSVEQVSSCSVITSLKLTITLLSQESLAVNRYGFGILSHSTIIFSGSCSEKTGSVLSSKVNTTLSGGATPPHSSVTVYITGIVPPKPQVELKLVYK